MRYSLTFSLLLLSAAILLGVAAVNGATTEYDEGLSLDVQAGMPAALHDVLVGVSLPVDEWYGYLSAALLVGLVYWRLGRRPARFVLLAGTAAVVVCAAAKWIYARPRPSDPIAVLAPHPASGSYPSGHVVWVAGFVGAAIYASCRDRSPRARRLGLVLFAAALAVMALSRVYLGQHFATDTFGGALLGVGFLTAALAFKKAEDPTRPRPPA